MACFLSLFYKLNEISLTFFKSKQKKKIFASSSKHKLSELEKLISAYLK